MAGLLANRVTGMRDGLELDAANDEIFGGFDACVAVRFERLPRNLDEALDVLSGDDLLLDASDPVLVGIIENGRRAELEEFRTHVAGWELDRYLRKSCSGFQNEARFHSQSAILRSSAAGQCSRRLWT